MKAAFYKKTAFMMIIAFVLLFMYRLSPHIGDSQKECLWAIILVASAALVGFIVPMCFKTESLQVFLVCFFSVLTIRMLLVLSGLVIISWFVFLRAKAFVCWSLFFYVGLLFMETYSTVREIQRHYWGKPDFFGENGNGSIIGKCRSGRRSC